MATQTVMGKRKVGRRPGTPLHHQIYLLLARQIQEREYPADKPLPSEPDLAMRLGVSRVTLRRTLERLEREGLVVRRRGAGTFPATPKRAVERDDIARLATNLMTLDLDTEAELLEMAFGPAGAAVSEALHLPDGSNCLRIGRLRHKAGRPVSHTTIHVPARYCETLTRQRLGDRPVSVVLEEAGYIPARADQALTVSVADPAVAEALALEPGAPLLAMRRVLFGEDGKPLLHQLSLYPPDRYEYRMTLTRDAGSTGLRWTPIEPS